MAVFVMAAALAVCGVVSGFLLGAAVSSEPLLDTLAPPDYVRAKQFSGPRLDPLMPIMVCSSGLLDLAAALLAPTVAARAGFGLAFLATAAVVVISLLVNVPINRWVGGLDPDRLPADFAERDPRARWRRAHLARTGLIGFAVCADLAAVIALVVS